MLMQTQRHYAHPRCWIAETITGVYKGSQCGDMCYGAFQLDSGESVFMLADPDQLDQELGEEGNRVSVKLRCPTVLECIR